MSDVINDSDPPVVESVVDFVMMSRDCWRGDFANYLIWASCGAESGSLRDLVRGPRYLILLELAGPMKRGFLPDYHHRCHRDMRHIEDLKETLGLKNEQHRLYI